MTDSIFNSDTKTPEVPVPTENVLEALVGEGKKYKDFEALAKSKVSGDIHIRHIEEENAELRRQLNSIQRLEEVVSKLQKPAEVPTPRPVEPTPAPERTTPELTEEAIEKILAKREYTQKVQTNAQRVATEFERVFGPTWQSTVLQKAPSLGLNKETVDHLAKTAPDALLALYNVKADQRPSFVPSGVPTNELQRRPSEHAGGVNTWSYFEKIRKEDPKRYHSKEVQDQLLRFHANAMSNGDETYFR